MNHNLHGLLVSVALQLELCLHHGGVLRVTGTLKEADLDIKEVTPKESEGYLNVNQVLE